MKAKTRPLMAMGAVIAAGAVITACGSDGGGTVSGADAQKMVENAADGDGAVECAISDEDMEGVVYIRGKEFRLDGVVTEDAAVEEGDQLDMFSAAGEISMLHTGGMVYMWEPGATDGVVMDVSEFSDDDLPFDIDELEDSDEFDDMECKPYKGSDKVFQVPGDVEFMDFGAMFADMFGGEDFGELFGDPELAELFDSDELQGMFDDPEMQELLDQLSGAN